MTETACELRNRHPVSKFLSESSLQRDRATAQDHFMDPPSVVYQDLAFQRAFEELRRQGYSEQKMVPMARKVLLSPTRGLRLEAVQLLVQAKDFLQGRFGIDRKNPLLKGGQKSFLQRSILLDQIS